MKWTETVVSSFSVNYCVSTDREKPQKAFVIVVGRWTETRTSEYLPITDSSANRYTVTFDRIILKRI